MTVSVDNSSMARLPLRDKAKTLAKMHGDVDKALVRIKSNTIKTKLQLGDLMSQVEL